ncbi:MAG: RNA polymerase factor sigma-54 [Thermodesulfobacteriota bacterium]
MPQSMKQELRLSQQLIMTPQLQLAIKLLQLPRLELSEYLKQELESNPVLDHDDEGDGTQETPVNKDSDDQELQSYMESYSGSLPDYGYDGSDEAEGSTVERISTQQTTLVDHLMWQLKMSEFTEREMEIATYIIGNVDEEGYLRVVDGRGDSGTIEEEALREIAGQTGGAVNEVVDVLERVQQFDPPGVAARSIRECLLVQARLLPVRDAIVEAVIADHLDALEKRRYGAIASTLGVPVESILEAARGIATLNPRPGRAYGSEEVTLVVPDVYVYKVGDEYVVVTNEDGLPKLRISAYYRSLMMNNTREVVSAKGYVKERLRSAMWLIRSMHQRQRTIHRVVECIIERQREFLDKGMEYLRPMVLRDVAEEIDVHESTVSRVTANKYVHTPRGIFELKFFFSKAINKTDGSDVSADWIKEMITKIVEKEDRRAPLCDERITEIIRGSGFVLARRTVAKYREALGIPPSGRRKSYF